MRIVCKYGSCSSKQTSSIREVRGAPGVFFVKFPSLNNEKEKCQRWVNACSRKDFTIDKVSRGSYICSRHFYGFRGPTPEYPDPIPLASVWEPIQEEITLIADVEETQEINDTQEASNKGYEECNVSDQKGSQDILDLKVLSPPMSWSMEKVNQGVMFIKHINGKIVLSCSFVGNGPVTVTITALGKNIPSDKIEKHLDIKTNRDVYNYLSQLDKFKICPGNNDGELFRLYNVRRPNNHKRNSNYSSALKAVYSNRCEGLVPVSKNRCASCQQYRSSLRTLRCRYQAISKKVTKDITIKDKTKRASKTKLLLSEKGKQDLSTLKRLFKEKLKKEKPGSFMALFIKQQLLALERSKYGMRWDSFFLKWCSYIKNKSKSAYKALELSGIIKLPTTRTLYHHEHTITNKSGFNEDAINEMINITDIDNLPEHKKYFVLLLDEMAIKPDLICHKDTGYVTGFIDVLDHHNSLNDTVMREKGTTVPPLATSILQLMLRGITSNIKIPFAHFPTKGVTSAELYSIVWEAISLLENNGFRILAVVGDGASINRKVFRMCADHQGTKNVPFATSNIHAADEERDIYFLSDAPHLIKTVRNCVSNSGANSNSRSLWINGEDISWKVILRLYYTQLRMKGQFKNVSKLTYSHVFLNAYSKMKVNLACQVLSETVASAIEVLFGEDKYQETVKFIRTFDKFFDLCNVGNCFEALAKRKPNKRIYEHEHDERLQWLEVDFIKYLDDWESDVLNRPGDYSKTERSNMLLSATTIEGLRMTALSTVQIVRFLLKKGAKYVLTQHLNQDPLEQYFGRQRCSGGRNCNPSVSLFEANMDKLKALKGLVVEAIHGNTTISEKTVL